MKKMEQELATQQEEIVLEEFDRETELIEQETLGEGYLCLLNLKNIFKSCLI